MCIDDQLPNIQTYGQLLPIDALLRILDRDKSMPGLSDSDYHLTGERLNDAINRSWIRMLNLWRNFQNLRNSLSESETGTSQTRENFLLPLFQELGYGRLSPAKAFERQLVLPDGEALSYPISHFRDESPIHLVGCNVSLDKKSAGISGAARQSPHSLVQEFLNRSKNHLWGFVSNGLSLRLLRDNANLSAQACVDFRLEQIFGSESFSEFALLWLCAHQSRVHTDNEAPEKCWLELWSQQAHKAAVAALDTLRENVRAAIEILGRGFLLANSDLRQKLTQYSLDSKAYFRQILRLVYRLIFLLVVEERDLLHAPDVPEKIRQLYRKYWSVSRLRDLSGQVYGTKHQDLWEGLKYIMSSLGQKQGCPSLGLSPLGSFLWSPKALPDLEGLKLNNEDLLSALRALAWTNLAYERRPVDWRHLGAMELGSIYESLLELQPEISAEDFKLLAAFGNDRKNTGSYYTPTPLIESLLDSALEPVIQKALKKPDAELALLNLKICDPACGSGHFLIAAAKRLAKRLAQLRSGDSEPSPEALRSSLREVINSCIYGVDINPMSLEICKLGLWLESHEPGKALSFLDHHLIHGNSLLGTNRQAIREGIPASAYEALEGSDKKAIAALKKSAREQKTKLGLLQFKQFETEAQTLINAVKELQLEDLPANSLEEMEWREKIWRDWLNSPEWQRKKFLYDLWTAAFLLPAYFHDTGKKAPDGTAILESKPFGAGWMDLLNFVSGKSLPKGLAEAVQKTAAKYHFFHLELMFPEVSAKGGFDLMLSNPPW